MDRDSPPSGCSSPRPAVSSSHRRHRPGLGGSLRTAGAATHQREVSAAQSDMPGPAPPVRLTTPLHTSRLVLRTWEPFLCSSRASHPNIICQNDTRTQECSHKNTKPECTSPGCRALCLMELRFRLNVLSKMSNNNECYIAIV